MSRILLIAPSWTDDHHVGNRRLTRHVRWLREAGHDVTIVSAGPVFSLNEDALATHIRIPDPLGVLGSNTGTASHRPARQPNALRRWLSYAALVPDLSIVWCRRVLSHSLVRHLARSSDLVTASSPPEAPLLAASVLAARFRLPFWMDMRDGWLDEPLKPLLRDHAWQRWRERRLEARCLNAAAVITVTSDVWRRMLLNRYPHLEAKASVVTNAAPEASFSPSVSHTGEWVYAGRFGSSRPERSVSTLARILEGTPLTVTGTLTASELDEIRRFGWVCKPEVSPTDLPEHLSHAAGLVLLSESMGSIPAKLFDYLAAGRPILAVCPKGSATHQALRETEHAFIAHPEQPNEQVMQAFRNATGRPGRYSVPHAFTEKAVRANLFEALEGVCGNG